MAKQPLAAFVSLVIMVMVAPAYANPGAWVLEPGSWQIIHNTSYYHSDERFNALGGKTPQPTYQKVEYNPYIEYGLWDHTTIGANLFFQTAKTQGETNWGLADTEFFARTRVWQHEGAVISLQPLVKLPSLYDEDEPPALGGDQTDIALSLFAGYPFEFFDRQHFTEIELQYRHRLGGPADQYRINSTLGINITPSWQVLAQSFVILAADELDVSNFTQSSRDDFDLNKVQLSAVHHLSDEVSLQLGGFYNMDGRNTGNGFGGLFSVWHRF